MTVQSDLVPKNTSEPLPRGAVVDRNGNWTNAVRNWLEGKGRQIGEVISGINRNAENIVQLQTDFTAADGAITSAYISADAVVASDAESANAALSTAITSAYTAADATQQTEIDGLGIRVTSTEANITTLQSTTATNTSAIAVNSSSISANTTSISAIDGRVTTTEAGIVTNATAIVAEGAARATLESTVQAGTYSPVGGNYAFNSAFEADFEGWKAGWVGDSGLAKGGALDLYGTASKRYYVAYLTGTPTSGDVYDILSTNGSYLGNDVANTKVHALPVKAGDKVYASALLTASGISSVSVIIYWLQAAGTETGASASVAASGAVGTAFFSSFDSYTRLGGIATAPAGAAFAQIYIRCTCDGAANPLAIATELQICKVPSAQTALPLYVPGRDSTGALATSVKTLSDANIDSNGDSIAQWVVEASAGGGDPTRLGLRRGSDGSSEIALDAKEIFFGSDTVFEDTHDTMHTTGGSYRLRDRGPFGSSGDLLWWYGPTSVALNSETKTNGIRAVATDGKTYLGGVAETSFSVPNMGSVSGTAINPEGNATTGSMTASPANGATPYTYAWRCSDPEVSITSPTAASTTFTRATDEFNDIGATVWCDVTDNDSNVATGTGTAVFNHYDVS